ncbi:MAG: hypothetical protein JXR64_06525 [Spirochaetales bacterium]|nr:hypothetical protein [Spirochaetales bacterium]
MNKLIFLIFLIPFSLSALDYGVNLNNEAEFGSSNFVNTTTVSPWFNLKTKNNLSLDIKGSLSYTTVDQPEFPDFLELDLLKLTKVSGNNKLELGRYSVSDLTALKINEILNGITLTNSLNGVKTYTGIYYAFPKNQAFIGKTGVTLKPIFSQTLSFEILYNLDMEKENLLLEYDSIVDSENQLVEGHIGSDTYNLTAYLKGKITPVEYLFFNLFYTYTGGTTLSDSNGEYFENSLISNHYTQLNITKYLPTLLNSFVKYTIDYDTTKDFEFTNSIAIGLVPINRLNTYVELVVTNEVSEVNINLGYTVFSDLKVSLDTAIKVPESDFTITLGTTLFI